MTAQKNIQDKIKLLVYVVALAIFVASCANEVAPTGGKKDADPPQHVSSSPPSQTVNFREKKIKIRFNEYLENSSFARTLMSPPAATNPKVRINLKTITVTLPENLENNTTYILNFADDIRDINESNPVKNFTYVFSTGDKIDTQSVGGKLTDAFTGEPVEDVLVMLYKKDSLSSIRTTKPKYFAITDRKGNYSINHVKPEEYSIAALKDQNMNFIFDQSTEKIAFVDESINLKDSAILVQNLQLFTQPNQNPKLIEAEQTEPGKLQLVFSGIVKTIRVEGALAERKHISYFNDAKDTLVIWHEAIDKKEDTLYLFVNDTLKDTARIKLKPILIDSARTANKNSLRIDFQHVKAGKAAQIEQSFYACGVYEALKVFFSRPIADINDSTPAIFVKNDSTGQQHFPKMSIDEKTKLFSTVEFPKEENSFYTLFIPPGKFLDILGFSNDTTKLKFQTNGAENYGGLKLKVNSTSSAFRIVEILDLANKKLHERIFVPGAVSKTYVFKNFAEGNYVIRVIEDLNKNGVWDAGNFDERLQPEPVKYYREIPALKGGWEAEFELKLD